MRASAFSSSPSGQADEELRRRAGEGDELHRARQAACARTLGRFGDADALLPDRHPDPRHRAGVIGQRATVASVTPSDSRDGGLLGAVRDATTRPSKAFERPKNSATKAVARLVIDLARRADLLQHAAREHADAVRHRQRLFLVVRHEDGGDRQLLLQSAQLDPHRVAQLGVEVRERLVEQQQRRLRHDRAGQRDALLLAARELARQAPLQTLKPDQLQRLADTARGSSASSSRRRRRPKATFSKTLICGNSA